MKVAILAGGRGERLRPITDVIPKALVPLNGIPMLKLQLDLLINQGLTEFFILTGYKSEMIKDYVQSLQRQLEAMISIIETPDSYSPAERLLSVENKLGNDFLVVYCDNYIDDAYSIKQVIESSASCTFLIEKRASGNVSLVPSPEYHLDRSSLNPYVELGYFHIATSKFFEYLKQNCSLTETLATLSRNVKTEAVLTESKLLSTSTLNRFNLERSSRKTVFLDRDGILNRKMPDRTYLCSFADYEPLVDNIAFLSRISTYGIDYIIITNQPGIGTKDVEIEFLDKLHSKMTVELLLAGVPVIGIYVCPHHWEENCKCRKPKPGMLEKAIDDFELNKSCLAYIGDQAKDQAAAFSCGIPGLVISENTESGHDYFNSISDLETRLLQILGLESST